MHCNITFNKDLDNKFSTSTTIYVKKDKIERQTKISQCLSDTLFGSRKMLFSIGGFFFDVR